MSVTDYWESSSVIKGSAIAIVIDVSNPNNCNYVGAYGTKTNNQAVWGLDTETNKVYATYITSIIPFPGTWNGIKCLEYNP